jgi:hypothetical protein
MQKPKFVDKNQIRKTLISSAESGKAEKVKTTLLIDKTLKKLAQVYGLQNDKTLQEVVEEGLKKLLLS